MSDLNDALDALELMVDQYLDGNPEQGYDHIFMGAGEKACEVLARLRPERWVLTVSGLSPKRPDVESPEGP